MKNGKKAERGLGVQLFQKRPPHHVETLPLPRGQPPHSLLSASNTNNPTIRSSCSSKEAGAIQSGHQTVNLTPSGLILAGVASCNGLLCAAPVSCAAAEAKP